MRNLHRNQNRPLGFLLEEVDAVITARSWARTTLAAGNMRHAMQLSQPPKQAAAAMSLYLCWHCHMSCWGSMCGPTLGLGHAHSCELPAGS